MSLHGKLGMELLFLVAGLFLGVSTPGTLESPNTQSQDTQRPAADNSGANQRDKDSSSPTADRQKMNPADRDITKKIRTALHNDKSLSVYAHNVKIITQDGHVTLKGPVRSDDERTAIVSKATVIAGEGNVTDQLEVAPPKS
jgi:hyperosmotically inducible periplasmic protein